MRGFAASLWRLSARQTYYLLIVVAIIAAIMTGYIGFRVFTQFGDYQTDTDQVLSVTAPPSVTIANRAGSVDVVGDPNASMVHVHAIASANTKFFLNMLHVEIKQEGNTIAIAATGFGSSEVGSASGNTRRVKLEVVVPVHVDSLSITTNTAVSPVTVTNVTGEIATHTEYSQTDINSCHGSVVAETWNGSINVYGGTAMVTTRKNVSPVHVE